jgi:hypothetical protein
MGQMGILMQVALTEELAKFVFPELAAPWDGSGALLSCHVWLPVFGHRRACLSQPFDLLRSKFVGVKTGSVGFARTGLGRVALGKRS